MCIWVKRVEIVLQFNRADTLDIVKILDNHHNYIDIKDHTL